MTWELHGAAVHLQLGILTTVNEVSSATRSVFSPSPLQQTGACRQQVGHLLVIQDLVAFTAEGSKLGGHSLHWTSASGNPQITLTVLTAFHNSVVAFTTVLLQTASGLILKISVSFSSHQIIFHLIHTSDSIWGWCYVTWSDTVILDKNSLSRC